MVNINPVFKIGSKKRNQKSKNQESKKVLDQSAFYQFCQNVFEKLISKQLSTFFENILPKFQCRFKKSFRVQHCLLLTPMVYH